MTRSVVVVAVDRLRLATERLTEALASGRPDDVLACELPLVDAVRNLRSARGSVTSADREELRRLCEGVRANLERSKAMGETVAAILTAAIVPQGYERRGASRPAPIRTIVSRT
jgi:hypothetical protein